MTLKKFSIGFTLIIPIFSIFSASLAVAQSAEQSAEINIFSDITSSHMNFEALNYLKHKQVIKGYTDGTYKPDLKINRVEALTILLGASGIQPNPTPDLHLIQFTDIQNKNDWYVPALAESIQRKIVKGYDDGTFKPSQTVNLAEALKMLFLTNNVDLSTITSSEDALLAPFKGQWFEIYLQEALRMNLLKVSDGKISPGEELSRGDLAELMYRFMYVKEHNLSQFPENADEIWKIVTTKAFSLQLPKTWQFTELQGIDSYIGAFTGNNMSLGFDYGWYSGRLVDDNDPNYTIEYRTIDGYSAKFVKPKEGDGLTGVHFVSLEKDNKLTVHGRNLTPEQQEQAFRIFNTLHFEKKVPATIEIRNYMFSPQTITVKRGETVTWVNKDAVEHKIQGMKENSSGITSEFLKKNESYIKTFEEAGSFEYSSTFFPFMKGKVVVE